MCWATVNAAAAIPIRGNHVLFLPIPCDPQLRESPIAWARCVDSYGAEFLPTPIDVNNSAIRTWGTLLNITTTGASFRTYAYYMKKKDTTDWYYWPYEPRETSVAYTAIGMPVSLVSVEGGAKRSVPLFVSCVGVQVHGRATFRCGLPIDGDAEVEVFDVQGARIATVPLGHRNAGVHVVTWGLERDGGARVAAGVYVAKLRVGESASATRFVVLR